VKVYTKVAPLAALAGAIVAARANAAAQGALETAFPAAQVSAASALPAEAPLSRWHNLPVIEVAFGEGKRYRAIVDTALPACIVPPELASALKLHIEGPGQIHTLYGTIPVEVARPQSLRTGTLALTGVPIAVVDLWKRLSTSLPPEAPQVWIGSAAFANLVVTFDFAARVLRFAGPQPRPMPGVAIPFQMTGGRVWLDTWVNGRTRCLLALSTAASGILLPADAVGPTPYPVVRSEKVTHPDGKTGQIDVVRLEELAIGSHKLKNVEALRCADPRAAGMDPAFGTLGMDSFAGHRVTLHYPQRRLILERLPDRVRTPARPASPPRKP